MVEVKNEEQEETMREVGHLLLEVKCLARLGALASDSCICDDELQMQDNLEYYFILSSSIAIHILLLVFTTHKNKLGAQNNRDAVK